MLRDAVICILVYDITNKDSLIKLKERWIETIKNFKINNLFLIGNKNDMNEEKKISMDEAKIFQRENKIKMFCEVSAKNDSQEFLQNILNDFINKSNINYQEEEDNSTFTIHHVPEIKEKGWCERFCNWFD